MGTHPSPVLRPVSRPHQHEPPKDASESPAEYGGTDNVLNGGEAGLALIKELTNKIGADSMISEFALSAFLKACPRVGTAAVYMIAKGRLGYLNALFIFAPTCSCIDLALVRADMTRKDASRTASNVRPNAGGHHSHKPR